MSEEQSAEDILRQKGLYEGDVGTESLEVRRLLVFLLKGPYLWRDQKKQLWPLLINHQEELKVQLANLFLELFISESDGVAFVRPADTGDLEVPQLLPTYTYRFLDSVMLVAMRERLMHAAPHAQQALITDEEMVTYMRTFDPSVRNDEQQLRKRLNGIQKRFIDRHLLTKVNAMEGYVISPILKYVFDAGDLSALMEQYRQKQRDMEKSFAVTGQTDLLLNEDQDNVRKDEE